MAEQTVLASNTVHLSLDGYKGLLDLLLELARRQRVDLARISVAALVDQFVEAVIGTLQTDLMQSADRLVMAAWLIWLSRGCWCRPTPTRADRPTKLSTD